MRHQRRDRLCLLDRRRIPLTRKRVGLRRVESHRQIEGRLRRGKRERDPPLVKLRSCCRLFPIFTAGPRRPRRLLGQDRRFLGSRELAEVIGELVTFDSCARTTVARSAISASLRKYGSDIRSMGHTGMDRGTALELRFDGEGPIQEFQTLLHADEAKPPARLRGFDIKAHARIADREMDLIGRSPQSHFEVSYSTVFCRVMQSLLQHSKETK